MKRELRDKWLEDLRSGLYVQTTGTFEDNGAYCCLGVLCKSAGFAVRSGTEDNYPDVEEALGRLSEPVSVTLTELFWDEELERFVNREVTYENVLPTTLLWRMNDVGKWNFPQIADWVEQNIPVED